MQTTLTTTAGAEQAALAAAFAEWARLPSLAAALADGNTVSFVIDAGDGRVLLASPAGLAVCAALATADLQVVARDVARANPQDSAPRLARLPLDARRIAPPALCLVAKGARDDGRVVFLVVATTPVKLPRARTAPAVAPVGEAAPVAAPAQAATLNKGDRFLWRSDAAGALTTLSGSEGLAGLVGQRWQDLAETGRITGADGMFAALHDRSTFRAEPACLDLGDGPFQVELSGAPLGRGDAAFSGFGGFGLVRSVPAAARPPAPEPVATIEPKPILEAPSETAQTPDAPMEPASVAPHAEPAQNRESGAVPDPKPVASAAARAAEAAPPPVEPEPPAAIVEQRPTEPSLSTDEHAAFREIARALGARYAGDDASTESPAPRSEGGGAVMPFPGTHPGTPEPREATATATASGDAEFLAGLPLPTLVHRDGAILAANQALIEITGYADVAALTKAGLDRLFRGLPQPDGPEPAARRTAIETADGSARAVEVMGGAGTWEGRPATCLVLRPIDEADSAGALKAERLARAAQAERTAAAEAALDALEAGVLTLDGAGRIVALNRAAAELFGCDPREIVGGSFVALFDRECVLAVADALRGAAREPRPVSVAGRALTIGVSPAREDGRRVAVLSAAPAEPVQDEPAPSAETHPARALGLETALARLDRAFRGPLTGMVELADAMLKEPFGALGDVRYRGCLAQIKSSGALMLERVGELLDLATIEAGALRLDPRRIALNDVVAGCVARLQGEAARGRIVVRTSFSTDLDDLEADERSVSRAACLVIEHAIRRSAAGGQVIVSTGSTESAAVALRVRDTGAGATQTAAGPAGDVEDELALPRALIEANGGRLQLSARAEDGTLVEIIMPTRRAANG
ncbi:PAS domain-containing sensor histidine kinase [Methylobacterium sp. J-077]|uniref:PAS domain-containing sensor histidine kinase n=1 Tax=Methylobacterium sp. J-077 TaxID=2836656 RepID=UPI001FB8EE09|nr:PAS domain-containing protein [Methylobacterium sp. J-077]MCJ2123673.1 PAS domain-containing sensor histidine kinase [Methylobacterium sp. J-077]